MGGMDIKPTDKKIEPILVDAPVRRERIREKAVRALSQSFPFEGNRYRVEVDNVHVKPADVTPSQYKDALLKASSLSEPIRGDIRITDKATGKVLDQKKKATLLQLPYLTDHHTFIVRGNAYNVANQLRMKPGVYTRKRRNEELEASFNLSKGANFRVSMEPETGRFNMEYGSSKIPLYAVLRKMGVSDTELKRTWNPQLVENNMKASKGKEDRAIDRLYNKVIHPYARTAGEDKVQAIKNAFDQTAMDPEINKRTLGEGFDKVTPQALMSASKKLLTAYNSAEDLDERDNIAFKQIKGAEDFIAERIQLDGRGLRNKIISKIERSGAHTIDRAIPAAPFTRGIRTFLTTSDLSSNPTQINPMEILDQSVRITSLGEGGISSERAIPLEARHLHTSSAGILDPVRTPESGKAGIDIRAGVYMARDGEGNIYTAMKDPKTKQSRYVPASELVDKTVAFPNQGSSKKRWDVIKGGRVSSVDRSKVDYQIPNVHAMYSPATNMIPFLDSIDGNRATMGAKMQTQALPLVHSEAPLVQVKAQGIQDPAGTMEAYFGRTLVPVSPTAGRVTKIKDGKIYIKPVGEKTAAPSTAVNYYENFPLASKTYLHNELKVKPGDTVTKGQILAETPYVKDGQLALGRNLRVAYMPYRGLNTNDAVVLSESGAKKLTSSHMYRLGTDIESDMKTEAQSHRSYFGNKYRKEQYDKLGSDGLVKPGTKVNKGDLIATAIQRRELTPEDKMLGRLHKSLAKPYRDAAVTWDKDTPGEVVDVSRSGKSIRVTVKTEEPMNIGDKLASRYGAKGVVAAILPDDQIVQDEKGRPIDLVISSATVISRINPAQILETGLAKVAEHEGKPIAVDNFVDRDNVKFVKDRMKQYGIKDKETVFDPMTGKKIKGVLTGPQYTHKLFKSTDTNYSARGVGSYDANLQPSAGGSQGAKGMGRMEMNVLLAHDARNILKENSLLKSQKNDEWWSAYQTGAPLPKLKTSFAYDKFGAMLAGAGIKMDKRANNVTLGPLTDSDIDRMALGEVKNANLVRSKDLKEERGGLFDPAATGGLSGKKWSKYTLPTPVVNPVFERSARKLLNMTQAQFDDVIRREGGEGVRKRLAKIDRDGEFARIRAELPTMRKTQRSDAITRMKSLDALKIAGKKPEEAYILNKIPVMPPVFRPLTPGKKGNLLVSDANYLYKDVVLAAEANKAARDLTPKDQELANENLQDSVRALFGTTVSKNPQLQNRGVKGNLVRLSGAGSGPKSGFIHSKVLKRRLDLSGRGTIVPDPTLAMDEVGLPEEAAWDMYRPFLMKQLVHKGYPAIEAKRMIDEKHMSARDELIKETKNRPILVNRAPSLHRYNITAAYPKLVSGKTVMVPEVMAPAFGGDFDGDAVTYTVPATLEAVEDAKRMTLPNMILSDQYKGQLSKASPQQEAIAGIYQATGKPQGKKRTFKSEAEARAAYYRGEITLNTPVEIKNG